MSEMLTEAVTAEFDEQGKPINVEPGSALLSVETKGDCLVEQADPGVNLGSASCPRRCASCGTAGFVREGVYHSAIAPGDEGAPFCGRYQSRSAPVELAVRPSPEQVASPRGDAGLRALARTAGLGTIQLVPRGTSASEQAA